jgi:hypothetical protein
MPQMAHKSTVRGTFVYSFTTGVLAVKVSNWRIRNDADALAYALYLERQGKNDEAECFLERYLEQNR